MPLSKDNIRALLAVIDEDDDLRRTFVRHIGWPDSAVSRVDKGETLVDVWTDNADLPRLEPETVGRFLLQTSASTIGEGMMRPPSPPVDDDELQPASPVPNTTGHGAATLSVQLVRASASTHPKDTFWEAIINTSKQISFDSYRDRMDEIFCEKERWRGRSAYNDLIKATERFLKKRCTKGQESDYLKRVREGLPAPSRDTNEGIEGCTWGGLGLNVPCIELIWSYWHEQGMLVQTMSSIVARFQNLRIPQTEKLVQFTVDPLRPLNSLLYGFVEEERHRLTVARRVNEYDHEYGLRLKGKAVPQGLGVDRREKFLAAFHDLLAGAEQFYRDSNESTYQPDPFPTQNALRLLHRVMSEGAHNQFGDLPWQARIEMLAMQWLLARPEMREFLRERPMVDYREVWIGRVEAMTSIQGWPSGDVTNFRDLGFWGERLLLSVRYADWEDATEAQALSWLSAFRDDIRGYVHAYRAVTKVDLGQIGDVDSSLRYRDPSELLARSA